MNTDTQQIQGLQILCDEQTSNMIQNGEPLDAQTIRDRVDFAKRGVKLRLINPENVGALSTVSQSTRDMQQKDLG